ncbi:CLUMA_CG005367, isoform A [Clunio marinus]|uniref:CLUMA_CG005367, isoform A n=1 Tax=Clunio marinus TaxID=568069 RepID=A0A1J1HWJ7_9DIPT|nr:CLUMA_CG005367, isoform A [Clunio marinus]
MLLCLSNIGDIMASSFRFLYWRVCCYVCTREPKRNKKRQMVRKDTFRQQQQLALQDRPGRYSNRLPNQTSMRRSMKTSQRSADSGFDQRYDTGGMSHAYSDMDCRYVGLNGGNGGEQQLYYEEREKIQRGNSFQQRSTRSQQQPSSPRYGPDLREHRYRNGYRGARHTIDRERFAKYNEPEAYDDDDDVEEQQNPHVTRRERMREREREGGPLTPQQNRHLMRHSEDRQMDGSPRYNRAGASRVQSLDRRMMRRDPVISGFEQEPPCKAPIFANKYALEEMDERRGDGRRHHNFRSQSMPRQSRFGDRLYPPGGRGGAGDNRSLYNESNLEMQPTSKGRERKRERPAPSPSPRIMSPMGFAVHRQARHIASVMDENSLYGDDYEGYNSDGTYLRPVPIWLCVFLVIGYIIGGAFLFNTWEGWNLLDAAYFCFITLTTIGFGDFVPAQGEKENPEQSIALCSLYLLFGIALLAMSFNLVQEEVISKVKSIARRLGIIKDDEIED